MNGFTSSLHIRGATPKRVQQTLTDLLTAEGFEVLPADNAQESAEKQQITRGVWVAKSKGDWVSVFCSDFMFQQELGRELSKQLKTHALNVWVTEGSSWHYSLFQNGEEIDQFDSSGDGDEVDAMLDDQFEQLEEEFPDDDDGNDVAAAADDEEDVGPFAEGLTKIAELQEKISAEMPDEIKEIYDRLSEGTASLGDMRRFDRWSTDNQGALTRFQDQIQEQTAELTAAMQGMFQQFGGSEGDQAEVAQQMLGALPPDIAQMFSRLLAGEASAEEMQQLAADFGDEGTGELDDDLAALTDEDNDIAETTFNEVDEDDDFEDDDEPEGDGRSGLTEEQLQVHLGALQPLLSKQANRDELAETLMTHDDAPEEPLGELLDMLGIGNTLATFDFDLLEQSSEEDLEDAGIKLSPLLLVRSG